MLIVFCVVSALVWLLVAAVSSSGRGGSDGEGRVARRLAKLPPEDYKTVNDIMLPTVDGATTQIDHVVVSRYGIFVIETKNYSGWIFGGENQRTWTQSFRGGRWSGPQKFPFQNPIRQNWRHIYTMADCLELPRRYFYNVVAFCGEGEFMTEMPGNVMYSTDLCAYIRSFGVPIMSDAKVEQILARLVKIDAGISDEVRKPMFQGFTRTTTLCSCRSPASVVSSNARNAARRWFSGIGSRTGRRSTAVPNIRNVVVRDGHNVTCALQGMT